MSYHLKPGKLYRTKCEFKANRIEKNRIDSKLYRLEPNLILLFVGTLSEATGKIHTKNDFCIDMQVNMRGKFVFLHQKMLICGATKVTEFATRVFLEEIK